MVLDNFTLTLLYFKKSIFLLHFIVSNKAKKTICWNGFFPKNILTLQ